MNKKQVFLRYPPKNLEFQELFKFIWLQGIGNVRDDHGQPRPWTDATLETRFYELGYEIDKRTIQNWLSGSNKPSAKNLHRLARIVSNDDGGFKRLWRDAFTFANFAPEKVKDVPASLPLIEPSSQAHPENRRWFLMGVFIASVLLLLLAGVYFLRNNSQPVVVTNFKFCDEGRFDRTAKVCTTNVTHFPAGTSLIFVSFNMPNAPEGQPFERRWYREGQLFSEKDGFMDSAWEDYTWLKNPYGHDEGKYDLRIIVNCSVTTSSFFVGEVNEDHESP